MEGGRRNVCSRVFSFLFPLSTFLFLFLTASARPSLNRLDIRVVLLHNGDARITETRQMSIDSEGTECYIGLGVFDGSEVRDLTVSDETGLQYENVGSWDIDRSRSWKAGKCGIVVKHGGYELCWGLGDSGERTYVTSYTYTNLIHAHPDADAIRHVFLDAGVSPKPDKAYLTIEADSLLTDENSGIWGFRFGGELGFDNGKMVAYNDEPFGSSGAMYIMCRFDKGLFEPDIQDPDSFETKKQQAFEGSDYVGNGYGGSGGDDDEGFWAFVFMVIGFVVVPIVTGVWYRDIPMRGNLQQANDMLNAYRYFGTDYNNLLSACVLKLIDMGAISIESRLNQKGKSEQNFVIHELPNYADQPLLLRKIHSIFKTAAGSDTILEPKELKSFMRSTKNESITDSFINTLHTFGLKKFLKEFTLLDERGVKEVALWKDYMIYATLFGIADQVISDMKKINPEYFNMDQVANQMADNMTLPMIRSTLLNSTSRAVANKAAREARASGRGGHSSWG